MNPDLLTTLQRLHAHIDELTQPLHQRHAARLRCARGCSMCCVDDLTVFDVEAENIRRHHPDLLQDGEPHPPGRCAFLDEEGACRVYEHRPYVCRTQGLPLRWLEEADDGGVAELRDICPLNETEEPLQALPPQDCWSIGPVENALQRLQA